MSQSSASATPAATLLEPVSESDLASQNLRFVNLLLDSVGLFALAFGLGALAQIADETFLERGSDGFWVLMSLVYYTGFEASLGRTPAKFLTGTRVVATEGGPASVGQALVRSVVRLVPFEPLSFLFSRGRAPVGWHDRWSGTRVVRAGRRRTGRRAVHSPRAGEAMRPG